MVLGGMAIKCAKNTRRKESLPFRNPRWVEETDESHGIYSWKHLQFLFYFNTMQFRYIAQSAIPFLIQMRQLRFIRVFVSSSPRFSQLLLLRNADKWKRTTDRTSEQFLLMWNDDKHQRFKSSLPSFYPIVRNEITQVSGEERCFRPNSAENVHITTYDHLPHRIYFV